MGAAAVFERPNQGGQELGLETGGSEAPHVRWPSFEGVRKRVGDIPLSDARHDVSDVREQRGIFDRQPQPPHRFVWAAWVPTTGAGQSSERTMDTTHSEYDCSELRVTRGPHT